MGIRTRQDETPVSRYAPIVERRTFPGWIPRLVAAVVVGVLLTLVKLAILNSGSSAATGPPSAGQVQSQSEPAPQDTYFDRTSCTLGVAPSLNAQTSLTYAQATQVVEQLEAIVVEGVRHKRFDCYAEVYGVGTSNYNASTQQVSIGLYSQAVVDVNFAPRGGSAPAPSGRYDGREFSFDYTEYSDSPLHTLYGKLIKRDGQWEYAYTSYQSQG